MINEQARKISSAILAVVMVSMSFGMISSDSAQAAFIQPLSNNGLPSTFVAYDTAWNEAGTMAVVVGFDSSGTPGTNAYAYYPNNDTYVPIQNQGYNQQRLHAVDYFKQPIYDWPNVLLVDADYMEENLIGYYQTIFSNCQAYVDTWDVWYGMGHGMSVNQGKPSAAVMASYDLVVWIPSRFMVGMGGAGDALNPADAAQIALYLNGGGNFFLSNLEFSTFHSFAGPGNFGYDYLGCNGANIGTDYEYYAWPKAGDSVYSDLSYGWQNWNMGYGWSGMISATDNLFAGLGTYCYEGENGVGSRANTGLRYDSGVFKTIYFGFPLETLQIGYASQLMQATLDWLTSPPPDQESNYWGSSGAIDVGGSANPFAQSFIPTQNSISKLEFFMYSNGASSDDFNIEIREDAGNQPSGTVLATGSISAAEIPDSGGDARWVMCELGGGGTALTIGMTYWIHCWRNGFSSNQYWYVDYANSYLNGEAKGLSGSWNFLGYDFLFRTYPQVSGGTPKSISLVPLKDNTIYEESTSYSNGAGDFLISGTNWNPDSRRALMEFNIASAIPKYSTITSAQLTLYCNYAYNSNFESMSLHMMYNEWGEASSHALGDEEWGTNAEMGDATWQYRYFNTDSWGIWGGDYAPESTSQWVDVDDAYYTWSSSQLIEDVQVCLDVPTANHGWVLIGNEGSMDSYKSFNSVNNIDVPTRPQLIITYNEPVVIGYEDVFWIAGDTYGPTPQATCYNVVPSEMLRLKPMNDAMAGDPQFFALAVDDIGNPLCAGQGISNLYYFDGSNWNTINGGIDLTSYSFSGLDFNPNDRRFYATGMDFMFYTDTVPLIYGESKCYLFNHFPNYGGSMNSDLAWNELYDYGLLGGDTYLIKVWPYGEYSNGTVRYELINENVQDHYYDISWDTDGWDEAGITGSTSGAKAYWRYYNTNPQLLEGFVGGVGSGTYYTCAMKPPASPKWLFIPIGGGSIRANIMEKDESHDITISSEFPHIFTTGMWKQSDPARLTTFNTQVEVDSTYTFFIECNYTRNGVDQWDSSLGIYFQGWWDGGLVGTNSLPWDMTWTSGTLRTRQFNISYNPALGIADLNYPDTTLGVEEFAIHSYWEDPVTSGSDNSHHSLYINVTFEKQTTMAPGDGVWNSGNSWDVTTLNDPSTWDFKTLLYDTGVAGPYNASYAEFAAQRYAAISVLGNPTGSIPPGSSDVLVTPNLITYSSNAQYQLNVSIPNLYKNGDTGSPFFILATWVSVLNDQPDADGSNSDTWDWTTFTAPNDDLCIWGLESGTYIGPSGHGTVSAGPDYSDFTVAPGVFQPTPLRWQVSVPAGTPEGTYRATITITLWSY